ncbi:hypothetical protein [Parabacteroides goldsteinii]|nr:hypothetical protein [Parabacteroides goldsteinii]
MKTPVAREVIRSVCRVNGCIPADKPAISQAFSSVTEKLWNCLGNEKQQ